MKPALGALLNAEYPLDELVDIGVLCEELGYDYLWYTDVRFARECYLGLAAIAAKTSRIRLGTGVTDPYSRHPAITASTIATLDEMCHGRAVLGLGTGGSGFKELGIERALPVAAMRETVETIRALLSGQEVTREGKVISLKKGRLSFSPVRETIPVYFATHGAQITRLAGRIADGVLIANTLRPDAFAFYLEQLHAGMAAEHRAPGSLDVGLRVEACIHDDDEAAFGVMRRRVASRVLGQYPHWDYLEQMGVTLPEAFVELAKERGGAAADEAAPMLPAPVVESMVLAGNPERVAAQLGSALVPDITQVTIRPHKVAGGDVRDVLRTFAQDVMPRVAHAAD